MSDNYRLTRRSALLLPLATAGCSWFDDLFGDTKKPLEGTRLPVLTPRRGLAVDNPAGRPVTLPPLVANANWVQSGGDAAHAPGNLAAAGTLGRAWSASLGEGGGYRQKITARPVVAGGHVFAMDSDGVVSAFAVKDGQHLWSTPTAQPDDDSTNVGGGIALDPDRDGGTLYASTGRAELVALTAATGKPRWRVALPTPARAAPTIAEGHLFVPTIDEQLLALSQDDGKRTWSYQGAEAATSVLGLPSPAYADGLLVAGFGSGDLACLRASTGAVIWTDGLSAGRGRTSLIDLPAVRALPVIREGAVFAIGLGGLFVSIDLRSGRRLWERDIGSQETPWLAGDWLFVVTLEQQLVAVNRSDGALAWASQLPQLEDPTDKKSDAIHWVAPVLAGGRLLVAGTSHQAMQLDPVSGAVLGKFDLADAPSVAPVVAAGTVFVITDDGSLTALR
jgi:outer membrane protein assembly factor BamB